MNIICIIDDKMTVTAPVVKGLVLYESKYRKGKEETFYKVLFVRNAILDSKQSESMKQVQKKIENENRGQEEKKVICRDLSIVEHYEEYWLEPGKLIDLIKRTAEIHESDNVIYLLDMELSRGEDKQYLNQNKECLSMRIYRKFIEMGENCKLFSSYSAEGFMKDWEEIFETTCKQEEKLPQIMSRGFLNYKYFDLRKGEEIFNGFDTE